MSQARPTRQRLAAAAIATMTVAIGFGAWPAAVLAAVPTAADDTVVVQRNAGPTSIDVLDNDTITEGDLITAATGATHGTVAMVSDGLSVTYKPDAGYSGTDTFDYTVTNDPDGDATATVTVKVNAPPVAVDDPAVPGCDPPDVFGGSFPILEDAGQVTLAADCSLTANDTDADGSIVAWDVVAPPTHGSLEWLPNQPGIVGYTPVLDFNSPAGDQPGGTWLSDSLTYEVIDDDGARSDPATLRIWVAPLNDAPTVTAGPATVHGTEDTPYSAPWATGITPGPANESTQAVHFQLTSDTNMFLFDVEPALAPDGTLSFTPAPNTTGSATVTFVAKDDGGLEDYGTPGAHSFDTSAPVSVQIVVDAAGDPPTAVDYSQTISEDAGPTLLNVLMSGSDPDGDPLTVIAVGTPSKGTATFTPGFITYTPDANATGTDTFSFTIADADGTPASATVHVTITAVNDAPSPGADAVTVAEDQAVASSVAVLENDTDVDGDTLSVAAAGGAARGVVTITGTSVRYKPNANAFGSDTVTYTVSDGHGGTATGSIAVTITPANDPPNAVNDGVPTPINLVLGGGAQAVPVLSNDTWLPDAPESLSIVSVTKGGHGMVAITGGGSGLTYLPTGTTAGIDVFTYTISDGHGLTDTASVQINVVKDVTKPKVSVPTVSISHVKGRTTSVLTVRWAITETQSGVRSEVLQIKTNSGAWTSISLPSSSARSRAVTVHIQRTIQFRVRATDKAGNASAYVLSHTIRT